HQRIFFQGANPDDESAAKSRVSLVPFLCKGGRLFLGAGTRVGRPSLRQGRQVDDVPGDVRSVQPSAGRFLVRGTARRFQPNAAAKQNGPLAFEPRNKITEPSTDSGDTLLNS